MILTEVGNKGKTTSVQEAEPTLVGYPCTYASDPGRQYRPAQGADS